MSKIALVTGASGNLGQSVVRKFIEQGYKVVGTVVPNDPASLNFPPELFQKKVVDLTNEIDSEKFVNTIAAETNSINAAVLTVGGFAIANVQDTKTSDVFKQYKLNFETAYNIARPVFLQMMKQGNGRIFLIGSKPGLNSAHSKGMVAYGLAKSLLFRLAELMNEEAKGKNIVVSVVVPGTIDTPQNRVAMPESNPENWVKPESIAEIIHFYCSPEAEVLREPIIKVYNNS